MGEFFASSFFNEWNLDLDQCEVAAPNLSLTRLPMVDSLSQQGYTKLLSLDALPTTDALDLLSVNVPEVSVAPEEEDAVSAFSMACIGGSSAGGDIGSSIGASASTSSVPPSIGKQAPELVLSPRTVADAPASVGPLHLKLGPGRVIAKRSRSNGGGARSQAEAKRLQHNQMMRENRERANRKFCALERLLENCSLGDMTSAPPAMRNKMQVLDRAMAQYPAMCARRARLRAELLLSEYPKVQTPPATQITTPDVLARILLASQRWKAAEIWAGEHPNLPLRLHSALLGSSNTLDTGTRLRTFCAARATAAERGTPDPLVARAAAMQANMWVPDLRAIEGTNNPALKHRRQASKYGVSTALYVPLKDGVLVLFHVDDELLQFEAGVRPYDAEELGKVDELALRLRTP